MREPPLLDLGICCIYLWIYLHSQLPPAFWFVWVNVFTASLVTWAQNFYPTLTDSLQASPLSFASINLCLYWIFLNISMMFPPPVQNQNLSSTSLLPQVGPRSSCLQNVFKYLSCPCHLSFSSCHSLLNALWPGVSLHHCPISSRVVATGDLGVTPSRSYFAIFLLPDAAAPFSTSGHSLFLEILSSWLCFWVRWIFSSLTVTPSSLLVCLCFLKHLGVPLTR